MSGEARYDGLGEWYDAEIRAGPARTVTTLGVKTLVSLLGPGPGSCLDVACGTGIAIPALIAAGWTVTGADLSETQLAIARDRLSGTSADLVHADATALPFDDGTFDAVVSLLAHTDFDDAARAFADMVRVLRPDGSFIYVGTHPCFVNPAATRRRDGSGVVLAAGYRQRGWRNHGPGLGSGIRGRVGTNHLPLASLINAVVQHGVRLERVAEPGEQDYPALLALAGRKSS